MYLYILCLESIDRLEKILAEIFEHLMESF